MASEYKENSDPNSSGFNIPKHVVGEAVCPLKSGKDHRSGSLIGITKDLETLAPVVKKSVSFEDSNDDWMVSQTIQPVAQSTQIADVSTQFVEDTVVVDPVKNDGCGSGDFSSNDDRFVMSLRPTQTQLEDSSVRTGVKRSRVDGGDVDGLDDSFSKLSQSDQEPVEKVAKRKEADIGGKSGLDANEGLGFVYGNRENLEDKIEQSWENLEKELDDEPKSGDFICPELVDYSDKDLYAGDAGDATKGDMYRNIEVEGDEDTDDEELFFSREDVGSDYEPEEDDFPKSDQPTPSGKSVNGNSVENNENAPRMTQESAGNLSETLPPGQSQLYEVDGGPRSQNGLNNPVFGDGVGDGSLVNPVQQPDGGSDQRNSGGDQPAAGDDRLSGAGEQPVGEQPVGEQPVSEQPVGEQPVDEQPADDDLPPDDDCGYGEYDLRGRSVNFVACQLYTKKR